ncbi:MAG: hypothetical protein JXP34_00420 [Planctomycetes bacterium]|nr:hypothetical protein [Planctomycetota bacterium]
MNRLKRWTLAAAAALLVSGSPGADDPPPSGSAPRAYAGVEHCRSCHPSAYRAWEGSKHARSFVALGTEGGRKVAREPGATTGMPTAKMMAVCSPCHAKGMEIPKEKRAKRFHPEDGVQCESCHGPRGEKDGRAMPCGAPEDPAYERGLEGCMDCHLHQPTHEVLGRKPFDLEKGWEKIIHGREASQTGENGSAGR